jgi:hypothetical protein
MKEMDVALTDFALAAQSFYIAWRVYRSPAPGAVKNPYQILFLGFGSAAAWGGIFHGFTESGTVEAAGSLTSLSEPALGHPWPAAVLWWLTMFSVGVTAYGFAIAGLRLIREGGHGGGRFLGVPVGTGTGPSMAGAAEKSVLGALVLYTAVLFFNRNFFIAILFYVPATLLMLTGLKALPNRCTPREVSSSLGETYQSFPLVWL